MKTSNGRDPPQSDDVVRSDSGALVVATAGVQTLPSTLLTVDGSRGAKRHTRFLPTLESNMRRKTSKEAIE